MTPNRPDTRTVEVAVDARNPGQVFACLGLLELCDLDARNREIDRPVARFESRDGDHVFRIDGHMDGHDLAALVRSLEIQAEEGVDDTEQPVRIRSSPHGIDIRLNSWKQFRRGDVAPRLFAGNQKAHPALAGILEGNSVSAKSKGGKVRQRWLDAHPSFVGLDAFDLSDEELPLPLNPMGYDARVGRPTVAVGFSENDAKIKRQSFVLVELLAPVGLQFSRPYRVPSGKGGGLVYVLWTEFLDVSLARVAVGGGLPTLGDESWRTDVVGSQRRGGNPFGSNDQYNTFLPAVRHKDYR